MSPRGCSISVDASFVGSHILAEIGGWMRNYEDKWITGFQKQIYVVDVIMAEFMGIIEEIYLAKKKKIL